MKYDDAMDVYSVRLTPKQARLARRLGKGSLSNGIRISIEICSKDIKTVLSNDDKDIDTNGNNQRDTR